MNGRANHIEDYLVTVRTGQWFGWSDSKNKIYENLIVYDGGTKPTEDEVNAGYQALKDNWTNTKYVSCLLYTSPSPRDRTRSRMPSSA